MPPACSTFSTTLKRNAATRSAPAISVWRSFARFFRLVALRDPDSLGIATRVLAIPIKREDKKLTLNLSQFVAHKHWGRRCASPRRFSANLLEIGEAQRWLRASMPPTLTFYKPAG